MLFCSTSVRRTRPFQRWSAALLVLVFTANCSGTRPAYLFQPAAVSAAPAPTQPESTIEDVAVAAPAPKPSASRQLLRIRPRQLRQAIRMAVTQDLGRAQAKPQLLSRPATQAVRHHTKALRKPAEVGLGTTVFGILGFLAVPIGLIGLALGGGLVWGLIAAAGALAILIAWLDPFA
ncbi:hypothetical protein [Hymenobacter sp.]|jgi:hypothetical protein|uniref:hypothetical protein n=1 Tax=Hymenobacter sp. TaxID=1898978 RepID=UPI002EDB0685